MPVPVLYSTFERGVNMPIQILNDTYVCRVSKATQVYKESNDIKPSIKRIPENTLFISHQQVEIDNNKIFHISSTFDELSYNDSIPYDRWIPSAFIEYYPMEDNTDFSFPVSKSEYFLTNNRKINLFDNTQSRNPLPYEVEEGVFIETDMYFIRKTKDKRETRYRIKAVNDDENHMYCGLWMEGNPIIYTNGAKLTSTDVGLTPIDKTSPGILFKKKKRIEDTAYVDEGKAILGRYADTGEGIGSPYTTTDKSNTWNETINKDIVALAVTIAKANGIRLEHKNFTAEYMNNENNKDRRDYWYYYNAASYRYGKNSHFNYTLSNTKVTQSELNAQEKTYIRYEFVAGAMTRARLEQLYGKDTVNKALEDISDDQFGKKYVSSAAADAYNLLSSTTGAVDNQIENTNYGSNDTINTDVNASISANGVTEDEIKAQRAAEVGAIEYTEGTLDELYQEYGLVYTTDVALTQVPIGRLSFVHGMPFQYTYLTDRRNNLNTPFGREMYETDEPVKSTKNSGAGLDMYGRTFAREIASNTPIVVFTPGTPKFMSNIRQSIFGYSGGEKNARNNFLNLFSDLTFFESSSALQSMFDDLEGEVFQYYSLEINTSEYYSIVNSLCQFSAKLMGLENFKMRNTPCTNFDWAAYNTNEAHDYSTMEDVFGVSRGVSFAFDPISSIQDSISNQTGESQFASLFNGVSEKSRELAFMLGTVDIDLDLIDQNEYTAAVNSVRTGAFSGITNPMSSVFSMLKNSAHGMRVRFPQLWQESSINKSYSLDMKFITPYATKFCKWRYVLVPFFHIFALAAPQSKDSIINYSRPFLVKAFSRGYFNIEMGIIDQLSWKRYGDGEMLSVDGIPTEIDVSVDVTDMYQQLAASTHYGDAGIMSLDRIKVFFNNAGLQELIGNLAGIDTNRITLSERLALYTSTIKGTLGGSSAGLGRHIQDRLLTNNVARWFYGMSGRAV